MDKKIKTKNTAPKLNDLSVEQRRRAIIKQKQCDTIALNIVQKLLDYPVEEDVFLQTLKYLNQCHLQDVVEERAISKLCGYPICGNPIPQMPAKKYHISTKSNKIYDITERKNYCSNFCYQAGIYIKDQMLTSPLWFRDREEIPNFKLLPRSAAGLPGEELDQGIIKLESTNNFTSISKFTEEALNHVPNDVCTKVNVKTDEIQTKTPTEMESKSYDYENEKFYQSFYHEPSLAEILRSTANDISEKPAADLVKNVTAKKTQELKEIVPEKSILKVESTKKRGKSVSFSSNNETRYFENNIVGNVIELKPRANDSTFKKPVNADSVNEPDVNKVENTPGTPSDEILVSVSGKQNVPKADKIQIIADKVVARNIDSASHTNKTMVCASKKLNDDANNLKKSHLRNSAIYRQVAATKRINLTQTTERSLHDRFNTYLKEWITLDSLVYLHGEDNIVNKISSNVYKDCLDNKSQTNMDEEKQRRYDSICRKLNLMELADRKFDSAVTGKKMKPLPSYDKLRMEADKMDLRVQAFYSGVFEEYDDDSESEEENEEKKDKNEKTGETKKTVTDEKPSAEYNVPAVLPLVESLDAIAIRKKIFLTSLSRTIPKVCEVFRLSPNSILSDIKKLTDTFQFTAENIVFKTFEWAIVTVILIKLLSIRDNQLNPVFEDEIVITYIQTQAQQNSSTKHEIDALLSNVISVEYFIENCINKCNAKKKI